MTERVWLYVFKNPSGGTAQGQLFYRDMPTKEMLKVLPTVLHRWEITGTSWADRSLNDLMHEYERRKARGNLPPDNTMKQTKGGAGAPIT